MYPENSALSLPARDLRLSLNRAHQVSTSPQPSTLDQQATPPMAVTHHLPLLLPLADTNLPRSPRTNKLPHSPLQQSESQSTPLTSLQDTRFSSSQVPQTSPPALTSSRPALTLLNSSRVSNRISRPVLMDLPPRLSQLTTNTLHPTETALILTPMGLLTQMETNLAKT